MGKQGHECSGTSQEKMLIILTHGDHSLDILLLRAVKLSLSWCSLSRRIFPELSSSLSHGAHCLDVSAQSCQGLSLMVLTV